MGEGVVSQSLNMCRVNGVRQTEKHTAEPLVPHYNAPEDETATDNWNIQIYIHHRFNSSRVTPFGSKKVRYEIPKHNNYAEKEGIT
jgi:hypothetical protein